MTWLDLECPRCGAAPFDRCRGPAGLLSAPHGSRVTLAAECEAAGWLLRVVWPIESLDLTGGEAVAQAKADLSNVARRHDAEVAGRAHYVVRDADDEAEWPGTPSVVICSVPAKRVGAACEMRS